MGAGIHLHREPLCMNGCTQTVKRLHAYHQRLAGMGRESSAPFAENRDSYPFKPLPICQERSTCLAVSREPSSNTPLKVSHKTPTTPRGGAGPSSETGEEMGRQGRSRRTRWSIGRGSRPQQRPSISPASRRQSWRGARQRPRPSRTSARRSNGAGAPRPASAATRACRLYLKSVGSRPPPRRKPLSLAMIPACAPPPRSPLRRQPP
jgi:hypothetical protein